jgi:prolyl 4-hydroxylase
MWRTLFTTIFITALLFLTLPTSFQTTPFYFNLSRYLPLTYKCARHAYHAQIISIDPLIIYFHNFTTPTESQHIIHLAGDDLSTSPVITADPSIKRSTARTSTSTFLSYSVDHIVTCLEQRVVDATRIPLSRTEPLEVVHYEIGQEYKPHFDYVDENVLNSDPWSVIGQRVNTMILYLSDVEEGGETEFQTLGIKFQPKRGDAVFWRNVDSGRREDPRTLHSGNPVIRGEKWTINVWQRELLKHQHVFNE